MVVQMNKAHNTPLVDEHTKQNDVKRNGEQE
ncbi:Uncharacterised protein [Chlamydia trachomatis]|nr:Uncharacterised protein [Chlamydia trachomatis]